MEPRRGLKNGAEQRTLAASHVDQPLEAREVVGREQRGSGPCDALGHDGIEDCGVGRMGGEVIEEGLPEDSFEHRVAGAGQIRKALRAGAKEKVQAETGRYYAAIGDDRCKAAR